jgi:RHS repeat-associated protein
MKADSHSMRCLLIALGGLCATVQPAPADTVRYYHLDAVGNVRAITDKNGVVVERHDYLPFGEEWCPNPPPGGVCGAPPPGQPRRFTGKERDTETGFDYFSGRYYGSRIGRFTTVDPVYNWNANLLNPQRWNRYAYVLNNPLRNIDPDGKDTIDLAIGFGKGVGSVAAGVLIAPFALIADPVGTVNGAASGIADTASALGFAAQNAGYVLDAYVQLSTSANGADQQALGSAFGQGAATAALTFAPAANGAPAQVQVNRGVGNAFRDEMAGLLQRAGREVQTEVYKKTPFGPRTIDIEVSQGGKVLGGVETKTGGSRYSPSQRAKDWWLKNAEGYPVNVVRDK